ncbi:hypothetical protein [Salinimicrobium sp. HB62]|uniref:hypothetical protein n=1 Tax=Salinimicrobium sp. HB62 TaxID=3077781 RepID=UPI002D7A3756|nr:hypothetical protein [Salinimicrobium sp. HB62]
MENVKKYPRVLFALFLVLLTSCSKSKEKKEISKLENELVTKDVLINKLTDSLSDLRRERDSLSAVVFFSNKN